MWGVLYDERTGLSFTIAPGPPGQSFSLPSSAGLIQAPGSLSVVFYDSQGYGGGIGTHPTEVWFQSCPVDLHDIASGRTAQRTPLPTFLLLLRDVTAVAERCLLRHRLAAGDVFGDAAWRDVFYCCFIVYCAIALQWLLLPVSWSQY
jgi:hypothetical protein